MVQSEETNTLKNCNFSSRKNAVTTAFSKVYLVFFAAFTIIVILMAMDFMSQYTFRSEMDVTATNNNGSL